MSNSFDTSIPSDIPLLLRADAEQCWLRHEVIPVLYDLETPELLAEEELGAALAYLEAMWSEATVRARETDSAHAHLQAHVQDQSKLAGTAGRYHAAVRMLRGLVAKRVKPLVEPMLEADGEQGSPATATLRVTDARRPGAGGRTPRTA